MPDTPFKAMGREKRDRRESLHGWGFANRYAKGEHCDKCGGFVYEGSWPFCKGDPEDHRRD